MAEGFGTVIAPGDRARYLNWYLATREHNLRLLVGKLPPLIERLKALTAAQLSTRPSRRG